jgi:DNA transformation protein and related proteins
MRPSRSRRLSHLVNIGAKTEQLLNEVGIYTQQELQELGPVEAWSRLKRLHPETGTLTWLYVLQGALLGLPWKTLPQEVVENLLVEAQRDKGFKPFQMPQGVECYNKAEDK